jgi:hypothetical protein
MNELDCWETASSRVLQVNRNFVNNELGVMILRGENKSVVAGITKHGTQPPRDEEGHLQIQAGSRKQKSLIEMLKTLR